MPRPLSVGLGLVMVALLIGVPVWYHSHRNRTFRNFHVVEKGVLYRSGQNTLRGLKRLIHDFGIKTVVSLRDGDKANDIEEENYLTTETAINFVRIPPRAWWASDGSVPAEIGLEQFRQVMNDPANYPVLVHCFAGIHRTGAFCAVRRMDHDGWTNDDAIQEMRNFGYTVEHMDVLPYLRNYHRRASGAVGSKAPAAVIPPTVPEASVLPVSRQKSPAP